MSSGFCFRARVFRFFVLSAELKRSTSQRDPSMGFHDSIDLWSAERGSKGCESMSMMSINTIPSKSCSPRLESPSYRNAGWEGGMNNVGMTCFFPLLLLRPVSLGRLGRAAAYRRHRLRVTICVCLARGNGSTPLKDHLLATRECKIRN
jgi:hypothetical protein